MQKIKYLLFIPIIIWYSSCKNNDQVHNVNEQLPSSEKTHENKKVVYTEPNAIVNKNCQLEQLLNDPTIPKMAKQLYTNTYQLKGDEPIALLQQLNNKDQLQYQFYLKAITNSYAISDGAYSEALGATAKDYIEKQTQEFASNFDNTACFTKKDLETWANIAMLEFEIIAENANAKELVKKYNEALIANCKNCTATQKQTINDFTAYLKTKEKEYFKD